PLGLEAIERQPLDDVAAEQVGLGVAGQLEDAAPGREDPPLLVADEEARVRRRVVVVHQLEEEAEAAVVTCDRHVVELPAPAVVDRALLAVRADEEGHESILASAIQAQIQRLRRKNQSWTSVVATISHHAHASPNYQWI